MTETQKQMETELDRVLGACRSAKVIELLEWLGRQAINNPRHRADWREVYYGAVNDEVPADKIDSENEVAIKNRAHRARKHLQDFYLTEGVAGSFWIDFPKNLADEERVGKKEGYGIRFRSGPRPAHIDQKRSTNRRLGAAAELWDEMINSLQPHHTFFIYPADPMDKYRDGPRGLEKYDDDRGLEAGSGEVAAAFMIGAVTSHLYSTFDIRRSFEVSVSQLEVPHSCFVYLGSSRKCRLFAVVEKPGTMAAAPILLLS